MRPDSLLTQMGLLLAALFITLTASAAPTSSAMQCRKIFDEVLWQNRILQLRYHIEEKSSKLADNTLSEADHLKFVKDAELALGMLLKIENIPYKYVTGQYPGFWILPEGDHPFSNLAKALAKKDMQLIASVDLWMMRALGGYSNNVVYIDYHSLFSKTTSFALAHELRHAQVAHLSFKGRHAYEMLFETGFNASETESKLLPGVAIKQGYHEAFRADEILAHKQSFAVLWSNYKRLKSERDLDGAREHTDRLVNLTGQLLAAVRVFKESIKEDAYYAMSYVPEESDKPMMTTVVRLKPLINRPLSTGLKMLMRIPNLAVFQGTNGEALLKKALLFELEHLENEAVAILPFASALRNAMKAFDGKNVEPVNEAFKDFSNTISARRKKLNEDNQD